MQPHTVGGWRPKLVALDVDGTLMSWSANGLGQTEAQIAPRVYRAIHRAVADGAHIVLASGRAVHLMTPIADLLDLPPATADRLWMIGANGAVTFRYPPAEVVLEITFDASAAVAAVLEHHPDAFVAVEEQGLRYRVNRPFPADELSGAISTAELAAMVSEPVNRVIIRDPQATAEDFTNLMAKLSLEGADHFVGMGGWLDLVPAGITKASGLEYVVQQLGIDRADVLAIGDGTNDLEMLRWAGRGVAMGQAPAEVHEAADAVTTSADDDGVAVELGRWFPDAAPHTQSPQRRARAIAWQPKVIALDVDGTVLDWTVNGLGQTEARIALPVRDAIQRAAAAGAHVVLASGREARAMTPVADLLELPTTAADRLWMVTSNGAIVLRYPPAEVVHELTFDPSAAVTAILQHRPEAFVAVEDQGTSYRVNRPFLPGDLSGTITATGIEAMLSEPVTRVIVRDLQASAAELTALMARLAISGIDYAAGATGPAPSDDPLAASAGAWLDLMPAGITKASGLERVVQQLGVDAADVLAIGDGRNDIEMLRWAGRGVAMGQAPPDVHEAADASTKSVTDDGVAVELDRWFPAPDRAD